MFFFATSYLIRVVYDFLIGFDIKGKGFGTYFTTVIFCLPFDLLPVYILLYYHRRNLVQMKSQMLNSRDVGAAFER